MDRDGLDAFTFLFSESAGRAVVAVPRSEELRFNDMCAARGFAHSASAWWTRKAARWRSPASRP